MQAVAQVRESTQVLMLSKKQWFEPRRLGLFWFGGVLRAGLYLCRACCC
jgi:hypothetical protein